MLDTNELCSHLVHLSHMPIRCYEEDGTYQFTYADQGDYPDPLRSDPDFEARLLAKASVCVPKLHFELEAVVYGIIHAKEQGIFIVGPCCLLRRSQDLSLQVAQRHHIDPKEPYHIPSCTMEFFFSVLSMLYHHLTGIYLSWTEIMTQGTEQNALQGSVREKLDDVYFSYNEQGKVHNPYSQEEREQDSIRRGDLDALHESFRETYIGEVGTLARNPLRHSKNIAITLIALSSRSAIAGGIPSEIAYSLSDAYVLQIEDLLHVDEVITLARQAEVHYATLVRDHIQGVQKNPLVTRCKEEVAKRPHQKISVAQLAEELGVTRNYLSQLFIKEEGISLLDYITQEKIYSSLPVLRYTKETFGEIAYQLGFSSQSHFGQAFKKVMGITPKQYRDRYAS